MADVQSCYAKTLDAMNEVSDLAGIARLPDQIITLQSQLTTANGTIATLNAAIAKAKAAAQADKDADAASVAGQGVLDVLP